MASVSSSTLILFIASILVAASVAGTMTNGVSRLSDALGDRSIDVSNEIRTDIDVISDPGSDAVYSDAETNVTLLLKNTGSQTLSTDPDTLDIIIDGQYATDVSTRVVGSDTDWEKGRLKVEEGEVALAIATGQFLEIDIDDVGTVGETEATVMGDERLVIQVEHSEDATVVQTNISGTRRHVSVLASLLRKGEAQNTTDHDLTDAETEVLMALYSGVSPFQIPEFTGMDVDTVEETFDSLTEAGILEEVRTRREVSLMARGRHIASEAMGEE